MQLEEYKKIISNAITKEVESYTFYKAIHDKVKDPALKSMFKELADEETKHRQLLEGYLSGAGKKLHFNEAKDYKMAKGMEKPAPTVDMKPIQGIELAIKREEEAMNMYVQFATLSTDAGQKDVFQELAKMELGHKARLEDIYTNMAFPEVW
jgi:rubrerythrin